jgi:DNA-binding transcriptional MerR regulator
MKTTSSKRYRPNEFARLAGVSVRALHYYDRLGLLKPQGRTGAGCRLYASEDFERLQQIVTLKFIGFSLKEIKRLVAGADLASALRAQRASLVQKRRQLGLAIDAIAEAERLPVSRRATDWKAFAKIIQRIQMQTNNEWTKQYYSEEAQKILAERNKLWSPELQEKISKDWMGLFCDIKDAIAKGVKPKSSEGRALAERWDKLIEGFTGGHATVQAGVQEVWCNFDKLPAEAKQKMQPFKNAIDDGVKAFYAEAKAK